MCRYGVGARRLGTMTRLELLPGPFRTRLFFTLYSIVGLISYLQDELSGVLLDPTYLGSFNRTVFRD